MSEFVPEGWKVSSVSEVANNFDGKRVALKSTDRAARQGRYRYYGASNIIDYVDDYIFDGDYILLGEDGENVLSRNLPLAFIVKGKFWVNNHAHVLQPKKNIDIGYLCEVLEAFNYKNIASGSAQPKITQGALNQISLLFPPLPEQQKIAAILTSVDEVIEKTQAQINKLKDLKTGMMQELLTRGVGVDGKPHTEFKDSPVGRIPKAWEVLPLSSLAITKGLQTGPFGGQLHADEYTEKGIPVIMPKNMKSNNVCIQNIARISEDKAIELSKHRVMEGDIVFSRRGDIGRFVLINKENEGWLCGTGSLRTRLDKTTILPLYLASYLTLDLVIEWLNNNAVGQTMLNLNTSILGELPVVLPPIYEQELIANSIESIDKRLGILGRKLSQIQKSKKALMQDLLTGRVRVKVDS